MKTVGYIILIEAKATQDKTSEAMSYGYPNETDSEMLLRRGRATLFESYEEAEQALKETLLAATAQNSKWPEKFIYKVVAVETASSHPKPDQEPDDLTIAYMSGFHDGKNKNAPQPKPEQEPVAWRSWNDKDKFGFWDTKSEAESWCDLDFDSEPLYTTPPPQREWVGLTDEDKNDCLVSADPCECLAKPESHQLMEDVEAKLREKNGG